MNGELMVREAVTDNRDEQIAQLEDEIRRLRGELATARGDAKRAQADAGNAVSALRKQLQPLYRALQAVFGEIEAGGFTDDDPVAKGSAKAKWDEWKQRLDPNCGRVIDALLLGGEMNVRAIMVACKMGEATVYRCTSKMGQAGILVRNGGRFSLKESA
jgi:ribosomal protein L29